MSARSGSQRCAAVDEQRARADPEALVDTSPVGVVVFDAKSGNALSFNREARRLVEKLRSPGCSTEQLLEVMTCRFSDGREIALDEFPLARELSSATNRDNRGHAQRSRTNFDENAAPQGLM